MIHNLDKQRAQKIIITQLIITVVMVIVCMWFDLIVARDVFIGGFAAAGGNGVFSYWVFGPYNAKKPGRLVSQFYNGELIKIVFIVIVFAIAMKGLSDLKPIALFMAFFVVQVLPPMLANKIAR